MNTPRLDGLELGVVDIGDSEKPRSIAVHSMKRLLFWTDVGSQQSIYRARVDGSDRLTLAFKLDGIAAIAIDQDLDLLFFAYNKRIDVMDIDGRNRYVCSIQFINLYENCFISKKYLSFNFCIASGEIWFRPT